MMMEAVSYRRLLLSLGMIHLEQWQLPDFTHYFPKFAEFSIGSLVLKHSELKDMWVNSHLLCSLIANAHRATSSDLLYFYL